MIAANIRFCFVYQEKILGRDKNSMQKNKSRFNS
jgi:hypothetical protein